MLFSGLIDVVNKLRIIKERRFVSMVGIFQVFVVFQVKFNFITPNFVPNFSQKVSIRISFFFLPWREKMLRNLLRRVTSRIPSTLVCLFFLLFLFHFSFPSYFVLWSSLLTLFFHLIFRQPSVAMPLGDFAAAV